ncbi:MAG: hypothetical protein PHR44_02440 [Candidatus Omnitrophica bacterium]|nr:hypothetical protein [Candidatus Omnitrophota bacterium]
MRTKQKISKFKDLISNNLNYLANAILVILLLTLFYIFCLKSVILESKVLLATLWALLLYTWKTWQLKDITFKHVSYTLRPVVVLDIINIENSDLTIDYQGLGKVLSVCAELRNIGEGIATNIFVGYSIFVKNSQGKEIQITANNRGRSLGSKEKRCVELTVIEDGLDLNEIALKLKSGQTENRTITIYYKDLEGNRYFTEMQQNFHGAGWTFLYTKEGSGMENS